MSTAPPTPRAVFIDLDGTLLDTAPDLAAAADAMLAEIGRAPLGEARVTTFIGKGLANLVKRCLQESAEPSETEHANALEIYLRHYGQLNGLRTTIYAGVREGLEKLRGMGLALACVTNKAERFTLPLLAMKQLAGYFDAVVSGDSLPQRKPHPAQIFHLCNRLGVTPPQTLLIGDSINDVQAARAAGCRIFLVPYGYNEGGNVRDLECDAIVTSLAEAAGLVARHLGSADDH